MNRRALTAALLLVAACNSGGAEDGVSRSEFVTTYVALRRATVAGASQATRDSILEAHGTTEEELRAYIEQRADDPDAIADTWREIMDSIAARDTIVTDNDTIPDSE